MTAHSSDAFLSIWEKSLFPPPDGGDWTVSYASMHRRRWARDCYDSVDGSSYRVVSERWSGEGRFYAVCRVYRIEELARPVRVEALGPEWASRRQAHRFARLLADGQTSKVAQLLVQRGFRDTEANRAWAALIAMDQ